MTSSVDHAGSGRILDPIDRNSEILFGLFMVLSFTGTLSVATAGREEVRTMLIGAIGCNIAWGLVDGVMYVLRCMVTRGRRAALEGAVRSASPEDAHRLIAGDMVLLSGAIGPTELEHVRQWIIGRPREDAPTARLTTTDVRGAMGVFLLVFASTFPVVLPFIFIGDLVVAKRLSAAIAIAMLFLCGHNWGRYAGLRPAWVGVTMVVLGILIEAVVIALGG